jgi:hypothetical protein
LSTRTTFQLIPSLPDVFDSHDRQQRLDKDNHNWEQEKGPEYLPESAGDHPYQRTFEHCAHWTGKRCLS